MPSSTDPNPALETLRAIERAEKYSVLLDGKLSVEKVADKGGSAIVHKGMLQLDQRSSMVVAIKTPPGLLRNDERTIKNFLREAHTWSKLQHKNVLPLRGIATEIDYTISMVSEWMEKGNAHDYVQEIKGIANGLEYLHHREAGTVVHGDLKGINVLISNEGQALLTDFGLSRLTNSTFTVTRSNPTGHSLRWSAPEIFDDAEPSAAADVWSFGMTTLELFTRKDPFENIQSSNAITKCIIMGELPLRPDEVDTEFRMTDDWWNVICRCWKDKPTERPNISAIVENIRHIFP